MLHMIGMAKRAGRLEIGEEPVSTACHGHHARLVLVASDTAENSLRRVAQFAEMGNAPLVPLPCTKGELGMALGRASCAMIAITEVGFASAVMKQLIRLEPDRYTEVAQRLESKATKTHRRQKEKRARQKELQRSKPWANQKKGEPPSRK